MLELYLVLGCGGKITGEFVICRETENVILDLSSVEVKNNLINFLDNPCELFNKPIVDTNIVSNILTILCDTYSAFSKELWQSIQYWIGQHKRCGIYLRLFLKKDYIKRDIDNQYITILPGETVINKSI